MEEKTFSKFALAGGTALALQFGHRNSIDIDMFGYDEINPILYNEILSNFGKISEKQVSQNIYISEINNIKVDFVNYSRYPQIDNILETDGIRMYSPKEISAMKLNAIAGRGSKKDFIDLYFFYRHKYTDASEFLMLKSLTYFEDADLHMAPKMFAEFDWDECKKRILKEVNKL